LLIEAFIEQYYNRCRLHSALAIGNGLPGLVVFRKSRLSIAFLSIE